jgi:hypothetical protein
MIHTLCEFRTEPLLSLAICLEQDIELLWLFFCKSSPGTYFPAFVCVLQFFKASRTQYVLAVGIKTHTLRQMWWNMPIIPATQEAEIGISPWLENKQIS